MKRRARGISPVIATVMLIAVGIALAISVWYMSQKYTRTSDVVQAEAMAVQNRYVVSSGTTYQLSVVSLQLTPKTNKYFTIKKIYLFITDSQGNTHQASVSYNSGSWSTDDSDSLDELDVVGPGVITGGQTVTITFTLKTSQFHITSVSFQVVMQDTSGKSYSFNSNAVNLE